MDKNQVTGLILISLLLLGYFYFAEDMQPPVQQSTPPSTEQQIESTPQSPATIKPAENSDQDSTTFAQQQQQYGDLANAMSGETHEVVLENQELKITFSTKGGAIKQVELKEFQTFDHQPLILFDESSSEMSFEVTLMDKQVDLMDLYFTDHKVTNDGDTTRLQFSIDLGNGNEIHQYYALGNRNELKYNIDLSSVGSNDPTTMAVFSWTDRLKKLERNLDQSRQNSSVNYYLTDGTFSDVGDGSNDLKQEVINQPIQWITMNQKFFTAGIFSHTPFQAAMVGSQVISEVDTSVVKDLEMVVNISQQSLSKDGFTYFFGPNNYQLMKKVTEGFSKNVYLGWAPFAWVNKWLIIPVFNFLEAYISNYGIIIIILAFFIKIILSPVSYKSYLSMAKMKVLKPQLDEIKEKYGDDMQKAQAEQMQLYGKVGVNPLSGCIPMLLQMPILLAMFNFFPNSVELRQAGFLWADDLSSYDSILNLPFEIPFYGDHISLFTLLMAVSTLLYTWQNQQMNTMQGPMKSMQYLMPVMMIFFFNNFSSGLTFYYFILNILNFGQQAIIKKYFIDEEKILRIMEENKAKNKHKKKSKFQARLEEAMKTAEESKKSKK
jgi:YidC/Oxa1 family membrane protein insertase